MHVAGYLAALFCCQNSSVSPINDGNQSNGHRRTLTVKYRVRPTADHVSDEDTCDVDRVPGWQEWAIPALGFKKTSWFLEDEEIRKFCDEASANRGAGTRPPTSIMQEHFGILLEHANILMSEINKDLVVDQSTQFGVNVTTGSNTGKVLNVSRTGGFVLDNGIVDLMRDLQENEICGTPCLVGGGLWSAWDIAQALQCCNNAGMDVSRLGLPQYFNDKASQTIWGPNTAALLAPGSVKFLGFNKYVGNFAGQKGNSFFATIPMPVQEFPCNMDECLRQLVLDFQMRYIDCPTEILVNGVETTVNRGWQFILSKEYALWVQPDDEYPAGDELEGTNGTLKYFLSNEEDSGSGGYAYVP